MRAVHLTHSAAASAIEHPLWPVVRAVGLVPDVVCHDDIAQVAGIDDILHGLHGGIVPLRVRCHELDTVCTCRVEHLLGFRCPDGSRLFHEDVFACGCCVKCGLVVQPVRQSADDDLHIVASDGVAIVCDEVYVLMLVGKRGGLIFPRLCDDRNLGARCLLDDIDVSPADASGAKYCNSVSHIPLIRSA